VELAGTNIFQSGLTLSLPVKAILPTEQLPLSWEITPTAAFAASGGKEIIGGGALTNVISYRWHDIAFTYGNYISFFQGDTLVDNDAQFPEGVSQQIMKNGLRVDIPFAKDWVFEAYGIYTNFFESAPVSSYFTFGAELGRHFTWVAGGKQVDLGYVSVGLYADEGNHYNSGHFKIGSAWKF
jgi:hypothetical protein